MSENIKTPHVHAELIKKFVDDTSQVVFVKSKAFNKWVSESMPLWNPGCEYFVVCAKHADAALHWLNGGKIEYLSKINGLWQEHGKPSFLENYKYRKVLTTEQMARIKTLGCALEDQRNSLEGFISSIECTKRTISEIEKEIASYEQ
jgi:hypothetical protein